MTETKHSQSYEQRVRMMASGLCERHFRVLPVRPWEKVPAVTDWPKVATDDVEVVSAWLAADEGFNIGLACGPQPNGLNIVVIDIDPKNDGFETWDAIAGSYFETPTSIKTAWHGTPSGGMHLFFDAPVAIRNSRRLGRGVDVRGEGGQVVLPPSRRRTEAGEIAPYTAAAGMGIWKHPILAMPQWLVELCLPAPRVLSVLPAYPEKWPDFSHDEITPAQWVRENLNWHTEIAARGWQISSTRGDQEFYVRPGKDAREGHSAVLHLPEGPLVNFSTNAGVDIERGLSLFEFLAESDFGGDRGACASWVRRELMPSEPASFGPRAALVTAAVALDDDLEIDWQKIGEAGPAVIEGFAFAGRWTQVVAKAKQGKSTFIMAVSLAAAFGENPYDGDHQEPVVVWYHDFEMGGLDVKGVLEGDFRLDPETLAERGWHASVRILALDTPEDARLLLDKVDQLGVKLVVLDGLNGAISGAEKDDVIWRALYRHTIAPLKERGVAIVSADNFGKDTTLGPRGSSVKMDKADAVVTLARTASGIKLEATLARTWMYDKERILTIHGVDGSEAVHYTRTNFALPSGTRELIAEMNLLGVPLDAGRDKVRKMFEEAGTTAGRNEVIAAALKERRRLAERSK